MVRTAKEILQIYADGAFSDWDEFLPMTEMVMNNTVSEATGFSPNYLCHGLEVDLGASGLDVKELGGDLMMRMGKAIDDAKETMERRRERMIRRLNRLRKQRVTIEDRDWVMLETEGLNAGGHALLSAKNRPRYLGPFRVIDSDQVLENYHLKLPPSLRRVYPRLSSQKLKVFHKADEAPMTQAQVLDRSLIGGVRGVE